MRWRFEALPPLEETPHRAFKWLENPVPFFDSSWTFLRLPTQEPPLVTLTPRSFFLPHKPPPSSRLFGEIPRDTWDFFLQHPKKPAEQMTPLIFHEFGDEAPILSHGPRTKLSSPSSLNEKVHLLPPLFPQARFLSPR